jgi:lipid-binding SYLF domain-containing protein
LTWIKGVRGQENTIPRAVTYGVSGILPTVFKAFPLPSPTDRRRYLQRKKRHEKIVTSVALVALLVGAAGISTPSRAEIGQVAVVFTKGGFIVGVGGGEGVLVLRGKRYPFTVSGMSVGFTIGASTTKFVGRALNLKGPASIEGSYAVGGAGGAVVAGAEVCNCKTPMV